MIVEMLTNVLDLSTLGRHLNEKDFVCYMFASIARRSESRVDNNRDTSANLDSVAPLCLEQKFQRIVKGLGYVCDCRYTYCRVDVSQNGIERPCLTSISYLWQASQRV